MIGIGKNVYFCILATEKITQHTSAACLKLISLMDTCVLRCTISLFSQMD